MLRYLVVLLVPLLLEAKTLQVGIQGGLGFYGDSIKTSPIYGIHFQIKPPTSPLVFESFLEMATSTFKEVREGTYEVDWRELKVGLSVKYPFAIFPALPINPYLGGGVCYHFFLRKFTGVSDVPIDDQSESVGCFHGLVGLVFSPPTLPFSFYLETRYMMLGSDKEPKSYPSLLAGISVRIL